MRRIATAVVIAPPLIAAIYFGSPYAEIVVLVLAGLMAWEWARICGADTFDLCTISMIAIAVCSLVLAIILAFDVAAWLITAGSIATALLAIRENKADPFWCALGVAYISLSCLAFLWLLLEPRFGRVVVLWLIATVIATDVAAYATGRTVKGPRLAPTISPGKTWSGLAGGVIGAGIVGFFTAGLAKLGSPGVLALLSGALALVAQAGDLFESSLKRRFSVKDSSQLLPGHGGILDRADGLLAGSLAVALLAVLTSGRG